MIKYNQEYFRNGCYFFLKESIDKIIVYYAVSDTLTESRKKDSKREFNKKHKLDLDKNIMKFLKSKNKITKKEIDTEFDKIEKKGEIEELINADGSFANSKIPFLNKWLHPRKTMDQTISMSRVTNDPVTRGYRVYWGEGEEKDNNIVSEVDYSDAFGYEETKNLDYKNTVKKLKNMGVENPKERAAEMGKSPKLDKTKLKKKGVFVKQRLAEKDAIEEEQKKRFEKMVEDILTKKTRDNADVMKKDHPLSKILLKNLKSIKNIADKEGININQLIKALKSDE